MTEPTEPTDSTDPTDPIERMEFRLASERMEPCASVRELFIAERSWRIRIPYKSSRL